MTSNEIRKELKKLNGKNTAILNLKDYHPATPIPAIHLWDEKTDKVLYGTFGMGLWCDFNEVTTLDKFTPSKILSISFIENDTENEWAKSIKGVKQ